MDDERSEVFQCQYCGKFASLSEATMAWMVEEWRSNDDQAVFSVVVTCGVSCADKVNDVRVAR